MVFEAFGAQVLGRGLVYGLEDRVGPAQGGVEEAEGE